MTGLQSTGQPQPGPAPPGPRPSGQRPARKVWWLLGAGVVVLALLVTGGVVLVRGGLGTSEEKRATEAAQRFMTAYAAGDADTVRGLFLPEVAALHDLSVMTNEVLAVSLQRAPITQVKLGKPRKDVASTYVVPASFTMGPLQTSMDLPVTVYSRRPATVDPHLPALQLHWLPGAEAKVNGVTAATNSPKVLPGSYQITMTNPHLAVENGERTVTMTEQAPAERPTLTFSDQGVEAYRTTVQQSLKACLAEKTIASSCGLAVQPGSGAQPVEGTVTRTMPAENLDRIGSSLKVRTRGATPQIAISDEPLGTVTLEYRCVRQGQEETCSSGKVLPLPKIDMSKPQLVVEWL